MDKKILTMDKLAPGDVVRMVGNYADNPFFNFIVIENDPEEKQVRFGRPYAVVSECPPSVYAALEDWKLPYRADIKFKLLSKYRVLS